MIRGIIDLNGNPHRRACHLWSDAALQKAANDDPSGALDLYQVHYYQSSYVLFDPARNPVSQYVSSGKPILVGEIGVGLSASLLESNVVSLIADLS